MTRDYVPGNPDETSSFGTRETGTGGIRDKATEFTSRVKDKAGQVGSNVSEKVSRQRESAAGGLDRVASTLHNKAASVPGGPKAERVAHKIASGMESTATYLRDHDFKDMGDDIVGVAKRHPTEALLSALVIGFLAGRAMKRR
jgi:type IV secretory pathway TrbL component